MTLLCCCWRKEAKEVEEEQLRESKMGLKPKPLKTIGPPCLLGLDPPQSMCSYRSAERLAPPPPTSGNPVLCVSDGEVSNSMELSSCAGMDLSSTKTMELFTLQNNISPTPSPLSKQVDSQASLSSTANFGENNICKKLSFSQSPVPKAQYRKSYGRDVSKRSVDFRTVNNGTPNLLKPSASPSLRLIKELDLDIEEWEWEDVLPSVNV